MAGSYVDSWDELVKKAVDAKAKASLQPSSILREIDLRCLRGNRPAHTTVAESQASTTRDPRDESSAPSEKTQDKPSLSSHLHSSRSENVDETSDKKEKKKQRRLDCKRARKDSTTATGVNASNVANTFSRARKDLSQVTC